MSSLEDDFTSTGRKLSHHKEAMLRLANGQTAVVTAHIIPTDRCQHDCTWCSVSKREGNTLKLEEITGFLDQLKAFPSFKATVISGGGNPILYEHFNEMVAEIKVRGLEIGLITNGMPLKWYGWRKSWKNVLPASLDALTWCRISLAGLDHQELRVDIPDFDVSKTTLGFSYVYAGDSDRLPWLRDQIAVLISTYHPKYVRLLPNCLEPDKIDERCDELRRFAESIDPKICFVQYKPPKAPHQCFMHAVHPVLNSDGWVFPCDSCTLNETAEHKFAEPWRLCRWDEIGDYLRKPLTSAVDPQKLCPGCVFNRQNTILESIVNGADLPLAGPVEHQNFV